MDFLNPKAFFDLSTTSYGKYLEQYEYVWEIVPNIRSICLEIMNELNMNLIGEEIGEFQKPLSNTLVIWQGKVYHTNFEVVGGDTTKKNFKVIINGNETHDATVLYAGCVLWDERIVLGKGVIVEPGTLIKGPAIIGDYAEIRQGAYIRGKCIVGNHCVVGHTTEMKNAIMLDGAKAGHFAYIGDSILGQDVNLGAGTKLANLKMNKKTIKIKLSDQKIETGLRKLGAILGDGTELGCNSVTNPGVLMGPQCLVWPGVLVPGAYYPPNSSISNR